MNVQRLASELRNVLSHYANIGGVVVRENQIFIDASRRAASHSVDADEDETFKIELTVVIS